MQESFMHMKTPSLHVKDCNILFNQNSAFIALTLSKSGSLSFHSTVIRDSVFVVSIQRTAAIQSSTACLTCNDMQAKTLHLRCLNCLTTNIVLGHLKKKQCRVSFFFFQNSISKSRNSGQLYILQAFQRRLDWSEDFQRTWEDYKIGFGNPSDYWIGICFLID
jgi:hypothetical protein